MSLALSDSFSLDILLCCPTLKVKHGDESIIYHPNDTVSGFLRIHGHANTVLESVSLALEGEPKQATCADVAADVYKGIVRIWETSPVGEEHVLAIQHKVSVSLSISHVASKPPSLNL